MASSGAEPPLKLLALDGGGIRGLSELFIIKEVMSRLMAEENVKRERDGLELLSKLPKPCEYFDLIAGNSTGGIIALMLGRLQMDLDEAIKHYDALAKTVFSDVKRWPRGADGKFKVEKLEKAIKCMVETVTGDPESALFQPGVCRTFVCAKNALNPISPMLFRTYQRNHDISLDCKIWEAARATCAVPFLFKHIKIGDQPFVHAGMGYNNPTFKVWKEAGALFGARRIGCLVSIGAGRAWAIDTRKPRFWQWSLPTSVIQMLTMIVIDCESAHQQMPAVFDSWRNIYFRLNVDHQGTKGVECEKMEDVEAPTTEYMRRNEVNEQLALLMKAMSPEQPQ